MIGAFKIVFWHWWTLAGVLFILEMTLPGVAFLFMAVGAAVAGLVLLIVPNIPLELQLLIFAVVGVAAAVTMRKLLPYRPASRKAADLNDRSGALVGRELVLSEPIVNGQGRIKIGDSSWPVSGPDMAAGFRVTVVSVDGSQLKVQPVS